LMNKEYNHKRKNQRGGGTGGLRTFKIIHIHTTYKNKKNKKDNTQWRERDRF
jgi:hypothetical protein